MGSIARDFDLFHQEKFGQQNPPILVCFERFSLKPTGRAPEGQGQTDLANFRNSPILGIVKTFDQNSVFWAFIYLFQENQARFIPDEEPG